MLTNLQYLIDILYTETIFYKDFQSSLENNPGSRVKSIYQVLFTADINSNGLFYVFSKAISVILQPPTNFSSSIPTSI